MWIIRNKKNGASWRITNEAKAEWEAGSYGRLFEFEKIPETPKAKKPEHVKPATKKHTKKTGSGAIDADES